MKNEFVKLSNGVEIPQLGFGVFQISPEETKNVVKKAIEVGYRHFDTAQAYFNEAEIGEAIKESKFQEKIYSLLLKYRFHHMVMKKLKKLFKNL